MGDSVKRQSSERCLMVPRRHLVRSKSQWLRNLTPKEKCRSIRSSQQQCNLQGPVQGVHCNLVWMAVLDDARSYLKSARLEFSCIVPGVVRNSGRCLFQAL